MEEPNQSDEKQENFKKCYSLKSNQLMNKMIDRSRQRSRGI